VYLETDVFGKVDLSLLELLYKLVDPSKITPPYYEIKLGNSLEILCKGEYVLHWIYNCVGDVPNLQIYNNTLYINNATMENQGYYYCHGKDKNNNAFFGRAGVTVMGNVV